MSDRYITRVATAAILLAVFAFGAFSHVGTASAQVGPDPNSNQTTITVNGMASTTLSADKVMLSLGVDTRNKTASTALDANNALTQNVINALESAGVQSSQIQTAYFNINPIYQNTPGTFGPGNLTGYSVTNTVIVTSSNPDSVSTWIDTAVKAGADRVNNVSFTVSADKIKSNIGPLVQQAITDARSRADQAAADLGLKVVGIKTISVNNGWGGGPFYGMLAAPTAGPVGGAIPIIAGQQQVSVNVNAVYILG